MTIGKQGRCHCGKVTVTVAHPPSAVTECHCSICSRYAALWSYYPVGDVKISGPTVSYSWGRKGIAFNRCGDCGCVVGWMPLGDYPECAINARLIDGFDARQVTLYVEDDASVEDP